MTMAVTVEGLSQRYDLWARGAGGYHTIRDSIAEAVASPWRRLRAARGGAVESKGRESLWALDDVSFEIRPGEVVGFLGRNGAGKSTLLKVLSRVTEPTSGRAILRGRVGSLLEVGAGFHSELTGRENIYLNGAILGMSRREIARKFDAIVGFSEVDRFLDTPVKRYSSGMYVRLAFAVASHLEPEILIVDEVLAVGDHAFQQRCLGKLDQVGREGRTVLFVSHNMAAIDKLCNRAVVLKDGRIVHDGDTTEAVRHYHRTLRGEDATDGHRFKLNGRGDSANGPVIHELEITEPGEADPAGFAAGATLRFRLRGEASRPIPRLAIQLIINKLGTGPVTSMSTMHSGQRLPDPILGEFRLTCAADGLALAPGEYTVSIVATTASTPLWRLSDVASFTILPTDYYGTGLNPEPGGGCVLTRQRWAFESIAQESARVPESSAT